ncbi:hypothetical protein OG618_37130 (plasmid) [Kitasatospora sp. NBC_01246]|uniref:hypothetical protein n=1 Tax=Kitasatospora sp. NBC_01246 TaxID=2903570 RepID=UPI002E356085|nr:hypothetical protein [Kitasatospora sp. NBC_01246]
MALVQTPLLVNGAIHPAQSWRLMIRDLARGNEGVGSGGDLKVTALPVAGTRVRIGDGSCIVQGRTSPWQGHYSAYNIGAYDVDIASTGSSARSDLVCVEVLDPEYGGGRNPAIDPTVQFTVVSNVANTATTPPPGMSAIALARIDLPAGTAAVTADMVRDVRAMANPRRERRLLPLVGFPYDPISDTGGVWQNWPNNAQWQLAVPRWATSVNLVTTLAGLRLSGGNVFADMRHSLGAMVGVSAQIDDDGGTGFRRAQHVIVDVLPVPEEIRGTTQPLRLQTAVYPDPGAVDTNSATSVILDVEWVEGLL